MQVKRLNIDPLPQRNFKFAVGEPQMDKEAYNLAIVLAATVRGLLGNQYGTSTIVMSPAAVKEIIERGAWLEIAEDEDNLILRTTLK